MGDIWDAGQYLRFGGERSRPFFDLIAQVGAADPRSVADLGCGPGNTANELAETAYRNYIGVDISEEALAKAARRTDAQAGFAHTMVAL